METQWIRSYDEPLKFAILPTLSASLTRVLVPSLSLSDSQIDARLKSSCIKLQCSILSGHSNCLINVIRILRSI